MLFRFFSKLYYSFINCFCISLNLFYIWSFFFQFEWEIHSVICMQYFFVLLYGLFLYNKTGIFYHKYLILRDSWYSYLSINDNERPNAFQISFVFCIITGFIGFCGILGNISFFIISLKYNNITLHLIEQIPATCIPQGAAVFATAPISTASSNVIDNEITLSDLESAYFKHSQDMGTLRDLNFHSTFLWKEHVTKLENFFLLYANDNDNDNDNVLDIDQKLEVVEKAIHSLNAINNIYLDYYRDCQIQFYQLQQLFCDKYLKSADCVKILMGIEKERFIVGKALEIVEQNIDRVLASPASQFFDNKNSIEEIKENNIIGDLSQFFLNLQIFDFKYLNVADDNDNIHNTWDLDSLLKEKIDLELKKISFNFELMYKDVEFRSIIAEMDKEYKKESEKFQILQDSFSVLSEKFNPQVKQIWQIIYENGSVFSGKLQDIDNLYFVGDKVQFLSLLSDKNAFLSHFNTFIEEHRVLNRQFAKFETFFFKEKMKLDELEKILNFVELWRERGYKTDNLKLVKRANQYEEMSWTLAKEFFDSRLALFIECKHLELLLYRLHR